MRVCRCSGVREVRQRERGTERVALWCKRKREVLSENEGNQRECSVCVSRVERWKHEWGRRDCLLCAMENPIYEKCQNVLYVERRREWLRRESQCKMRERYAVWREK